MNCWNKYVLPVFGFYLFISCSPGSMGPEELTAFVSDGDNGLRKSTNINEIQTDVTYRPTDLLVYQELGSTEADTASMHKLREKYSSYYYFVISFSRNGKEALHQPGSNDQYSDLVQTMSFQMSKYVNLTTPGDTIPVADFMLNRTFGMNTSTDILFVFNKEKAKGKPWIQLNIIEFGLGTGNQHFRFDVEDLENVPSIRFEPRKDAVSLNSVTHGACLLVTVFDTSISYYC